MLLLIAPLLAEVICFGVVLRMRTSVIGRSPVHVLNVALYFTSLIDSIDCAKGRLLLGDGLQTSTAQIVFSLSVGGFLPSGHFLCLQCTLSHQSLTVNLPIVSFSKGPISSSSLVSLRFLFASPIPFMVFFVLKPIFFLATFCSLSQC